MRAMPESSKIADLKIPPELAALMRLMFVPDWLSRLQLFEERTLRGMKPAPALAPAPAISFDDFCRVQRAMLRVPPAWSRPLRLPRWAQPRPRWG